ncbi:hypothetical protein GIB67_010025 [Kingdonia uniflora]|uniref:Uncharacterized protein n=1 Tax=Kingdonia uniflora TaxID=39325 RepID=A0A7J7KV45_9MAGN|nr:hypothetical protein GIB67_010025 [Kingdonia uniflora]
MKGVLSGNSYALVGKSVGGDVKVVCTDGAMEISRKGNLVQGGAMARPTKMIRKGNATRIHDECSRINGFIAEVEIVRLRLKIGEVIRTRKKHMIVPTTRKDLMIVNMSPQHPSIHGVLRLMVTLDGEGIIDCVPVLDAITVNAPEKLGNIQIPKRCSYIRVIMLELSLIASHLLWLGPFMPDIGAQTPFFYIFREGKYIYDLFEAVTGSGALAGLLHLREWKGKDGIESFLKPDLPISAAKRVRSYIEDPSAVELPPSQWVTYSAKLVDVGIFGLGAIWTTSDNYNSTVEKFYLVEENKRNKK